MSFHPDLLWLTLKLALITQCVSRNNKLPPPNFTYPARCFSLSSGARLLQFEDHSDNFVFIRGLTIRSFLTCISHKISIGKPTHTKFSSENAKERFTSKRDLCTNNNLTDFVKCKAKSNEVTLGTMLQAERSSVQVR
jgi:hypothetical protein